MTRSGMNAFRMKNFFFDDDDDDDVDPMITDVTTS
jgi:hypothetical protein